MRQPTTAEVRLTEHKQRVSAQRDQHLAVLAVSEVGCDRISLPRNPLGRKIATNNFGMSGQEAVMAAWRSTIERKTPPLRRRLASLAKKPSTALSQEAEVGV
jgi:hypothetical protein